ncbi:glycosyl hydrolase family 17 protein [Hyphobacterium sp. HN65]|uniref:Endo-1,3-beta-glucanase btgC n=1 Tax=Hyphobacterium lacteum TaxID=3116575 RepID=A0ABU7LSF4_9PROT|nr:glycosyl hydrolase family 17 protein [Hyphobacterium sp. HN65]MEE2526848.1 glycosyl hydrolase family 17 protein [Hyphobacterium sp. HN65]
MFAPAICYSGYRDGQSPPSGVFPSYQEIREDLEILARHWRYIRIYDCTPHAATVLKVIRDHKLPLQVMLGMGLQAEVSNPGCPWGGTYPEDILAANRRSNDAELRRMIGLSRKYRREVLAVSIGNEASVDWNDHMVSVERLIHFAKVLRRKARHPVTFCENYVPWTGKLDPLVPYLDVLGVHTYPVWEYKSIDEAMAYTNANFRAVKDRFPDIPVVITEAGWTTRANGRGIEPDNASEALQARYLEALEDWSRANGVLTFVFEAFDENWKGSADPDEPEKHWGVFTVDRTPKPAVAKRF